MGKRVAVTTVPETHHVYSTPTPARGSIRKRKRSAINAANSTRKVLRLSGAGASHYWHENDDEDSSSNDAPPPRNLGRNNQSSTKHANNSSILLNTSLNATYNLDISVNESPKPVYTLRPSVINGTILRDLTQKPWRLGRPIGKGNFGEIFLASDSISVPVTNENAKFVVKIEPHSNGPLFVEIHCLMNTAKKANDEERKQKQSAPTTLSNIPPTGIPDYIASGSHYFGDARYRFLVLQRFDRDLHSLIKNCRVSQKSVLTLAIHIINVLEKLHDKGYCHNDVKAQNLMISKCKYFKKQVNIERNGHGKNVSTSIKGKYTEHEDEKQQTTDSGNSSEQEELNDEDTRYMDYGIKYKGRKYNKYNEEDYEDFDDGSTSHSNNSNSMDIYETPINKNRKRRAREAVEFSGSNPVRSCRRQQRNSIYEEMVKSHYLRPAKRISYSEFFNEDASSIKGDTSGMHLMSSDDESEEFIPHTVRRTASKLISTCEKRLTRRQEKIAAKLHPLHMITYVANTTVPRFVAVEEERIFLIDFGLASKFMDNSMHRPFVMDQRRAHDGTLEFTSRDAHMGAHSRRSDLECLGYNLIFWSQGYLPWKEAVTQHQQEKVHRAKEYLMTDVREMLKQIYGKQVPKFLGEFLHYVGQLAYHERPDYARCRRIFEREYRQMNYTPSEIMLDSLEIGHTCVRFKEEIENIKDIFEMNKNSLSIMKNLTVGTPFHERTLSNRVSPKNLRSKSDKKATKKKKFSWAEILSQDPDQIARERAEKEFDREEELSDTQQPAVRKYEGKPTYAILEVQQQRMKINGQIVTKEDEQMDDEQEDDEVEENSEEDAQDEMEECEEEEVEDDGEEEEEKEDENENENDTDNEEADEEEEGNTRSEEENTDSDATEVSEATPRIKRRTRRTTREVTTKNSVRKSSTVRCNNKSKKDSDSKNDKVALTKTRTRRGTAKLKTNIEAKCGSATLKRSGRLMGTVINAAAAASAAGEIEHKTAKYRHIDNNGGGNTGVRLYGKPSERRTRRCLIKTDADELAGEESNSNFSPDVRNLFNVWKKINNESIYFRGSNAAATVAAKHCKK